MGYQGNRLDQLDQTIPNQTQLAYRFNQGVPNAVSYYLPDFGRRTITTLHGAFLQDTWTRGRLTLQGALRYDRASSYAPVEQNGTTDDVRWVTRDELAALPLLDVVNAALDAEKKTA